MDPEKVETKEDFILFVDELRNEFLRVGNTWENSNIGDFLGALSAWVNDLEGFYSSKEIQLDSVKWRLFADMLRAASMYE